ncbi:hypothetical protein AVEN_4796-1 [Araneus ventricosus]|uniref:Uncharacterized protein n=1 Tax=Araneus ventricosus TaxID=182803 RepID=A0A4Y2IHL5_ARAVE|nr:hypothetical protein AVEN_4796-1 [Araneus ventricosus]
MSSRCPDVSCFDQFKGSTNLQLEPKTLVKIVVCWGLIFLESIKRWEWATPSSELPADVLRGKVFYFNELGSGVEPRLVAPFYVKGDLGQP